ncbi:glycosyltransferase family 4 protein [Brevibacillus fulvus]
MMVTLLRHLDRTRFEPVLLVIDYSGPYVSFIPADVQVVTLSAHRLRRAWLPLIRAINRLRPDILLSTMDYVNFAILAGKILYRNQPKLIVREDNTPSRSIRALPPARRGIFRILYKFLYPQADQLIVQSEGMKADLLAFLPRLPQEKVIRIYNPIDFALILQQAERTEAARFATAGKQIVAVGRLTHQKGFDLLLRAFRLVVVRFADAQLTILGEGPLLHDLQQLAQSCGIAEQVTFAGFQENPHAWLAQADLFVLSSRWEGFPNVLLEALACGCPVVATDCPSGPREILQQNVYGRLVEPDNVAELASGMIDVLSGDRSFADGRKRAQMYDAVQVTRSYEQLFDCLRFAQREEPDRV